MAMRFGPQWEKLASTEPNQKRYKTLAGLTRLAKRFFLNFREDGIAGHEQ